MRGRKYTLESFSGDRYKLRFALYETVVLSVLSVCL